MKFWNDILSKKVLVTGAGGSIGSELCKQILIQKPNKLILIERNEPSLYKITEDISDNYKNSSEVKSILGSVCDENLIKNFNTIIETLEKEKLNVSIKGDLIKSSFLTSTMGISYKLKLTKNL